MLDLSRSTLNPNCKAGKKSTFLKQHEKPTVWSLDQPFALPRCHEGPIGRKVQELQALVERNKVEVMVKLHQIQFKAQGMTIRELKSTSSDNMYTPCRPWRRGLVMFSHVSTEWLPEWPMDPWTHGQGLQTVAIHIPSVYADLQDTGKQWKS